MSSQLLKNNIKLFISFSAFSICASLASVCWACVTYIYSLALADSYNVQWLSICLQTLWHLCMLIARLAAILLFIMLFGVWTLVPLGEFIDWDFF